MSGIERQIPANDDPKATPTYRALKAVVILLGVLIVLGVGALITGIALKLSGRHNSLPAERAFVLPQNAKIVSMTASGDRLILHVEVAGVDEIDIIDTETGQRVARIAPAPPGVP